MLASVSGIVKLNPDNAELLLQTRVKLVDKATGKEISNVPVDANGKYFIDGVKTGTYDVIAYDNYGDLASRQIIVPQNENWAITDIDMTMPTDGYIASNNATNNNSNNNVSSDLISVKNILFDNDSFTIDDIFKSDLKMISEYLKSTPNARIEIQGYCSQTGSSDYNMLLSTKRAENVKNAIIANGASAGQIEIKSFGYSNPIASNLYPDSRMFNRRTEIKILKDAPKLNPIQVYVPTYYRATEDLNYKDGAYFYSELKVFNELVVECVFFDFDKSDIRTEYTENLNILADYLKKNDKAKIKITGHTDYYGSDEYNMVLSQNRVVSVSNYLKSKGVKDSQIVMDFVGKKENITVATKDDMIRRLNRRVIITVLEQGTPTLKIAPIEVPKEYQIK
jgi:outer membrane protein OmpA-like peptidoglycan-associated protein